MLARIVLAGAIGSSVVQHAVLAASVPPGQEPSDSLPVALRRLTDIGGWRSRLEEAGLKLAFTFYGDAFTNPVGGVKQGPGYDGRLGMIIDANLGKLIGWQGATFRASAHFIHGTQFSTINLQNLALTSAIEAPPSTRLFNLWLGLDLGPTVNLRIGQFSTGQEFMNSGTAGLFVNSAFGWPVLPGLDLPSGSPTYPIATPGVRLAWKPNDELTLRVAVFNGDPAGPGTQNPVFRDPYGVSFRVNDLPLIIGEVAYAYNQDKAGGEDPHEEGTRTQQLRRAGGGAGGLPGTVKLGAWVHTGLFDDQRYNSTGGLLAVSGGLPLQHAGNFAIYGVIDQLLWRSGDRELSGFVRAVATPSDRNPLSFYLDAGLTYEGLFDSRPDDTIGIAFSYNRVSPRAAAYDRDLAIATATAMPIRRYETAIELTYQMVLAPNWSVQPTLQYIIYPGGHVPNPADPTGTTAIPNAFVAGLRTSVRF